MSFREFFRAYWKKHTFLLGLTLIATGMGVLLKSIEFLFFATTIWVALAYIIGRDWDRHHSVDQINSAGASP